MRAQSNDHTVRLVSPLTGNPAWIDNFPILTHAQLPAGTQWSLSNPASGSYQFGSPHDAIKAWGSIELTESGTLISLGGGHNNYSGNEVRECNLMVTAPAWAVTDTGTPAAQQIQTSEYYLDDKPSSFHSYHNLFFNENYQELWHHGPSAVYSISSPNSYNSVHRYDFVTKQYKPRAQNFAAARAGGTYWPKCKDPLTQDIYWLDSNDFRPLSRTRSSDRTTAIVANTNLGAQFAYASALFDPVRRWIFVGSGNAGGGGGATGYRVINITTAQVTNITLTGVANFNDVENQWHYDPVGDKYAIVIAHGPYGGTSWRYIEVTPSQSTTTWTASEVSIAGTPPGQMFYSGDGNTPLVGRSRWFPPLKGIIYIPFTVQPMWGIRRYA